MNDQETLRRALRCAAVGELSSRVAHDSNNLLAGILGQAELGLLSNDPVRMKLALESIVKSSREMKGVTERLLGFAKLMEEGPRNTSLMEIFRMVFGMLERSFLKAGAQVEKQFGEVPMTWCDPGGSAPPILYALRRALETVRRSGGGKVTLEAAREGSEIVFTVRVATADGGDLKTPQDKPGDLTLAQAQGFARQEGGLVAFVESQASSEVSCRFPVRLAPSLEEAHNAAGSSAVSPENGGPAAAKQRPLVALVVEDEPPIRELIQEVLEGVDCFVDAEPDGAAALRAFGRRRFDVVFTDISMPGMDGVTLVRRLRSIDPRAVVIVVTGRATEDAVRGALAAGANLVLRKPFELRELRTVVQSIRLDPTGSGLGEIARDFDNLLVS